jgi:hypothetical protein
MKYLLTIALLMPTFLSGQDNKNNQKIDGYKGIWFTLGQFTSEHGDKYSGGLGTYTAKHRPLAIYAEEAQRTYFVYGGTTTEDQKHLLCMISYYDHQSGVVPKPTVVFDKEGVDDPHDNPSLLIDKEGYLWVFVSGRGRRRPGFKYRSSKPHDIESFIQVTEEEMTYPQPLYHQDLGFFNFFTKYTGVRELYFESSADGQNWTEDIKLAGIVEEGASKSGHYQVSGQKGNLLGTFFSRHPDGNVDRRTDLYYVQSTDFGKSWTNAQGDPLMLPLTEVDNPAQVTDYASQGRNVYLKDMDYDTKGYPVCLYLTSGGHMPGPDNDPRQWNLTRFNGKSWDTKTVFQSDHNYDMGSLYIDDNHWLIIAPSATGPQPYHSGGEMAIWESTDGGSSWSMKNQLTDSSSMNHNYARRPLNATDPFFSFWADGDPSAFSKSRLYFADSDGNVYQLPYDMNAETQRPREIGN